MIGRRRGIAHDRVGALGLIEIEQLAGENTPLAPPFVRVLKRHGVGRGRQRQTGCLGNPIMTHHPANTAQCVAQILAGPGCNRIEQFERPGGIRRDRSTGLHDRKVVAAKVISCAFRC